MKIPINIQSELIILNLLKNITITKNIDVILLDLVKKSLAWRDQKEGSHVLTD